MQPRLISSLTLNVLLLGLVLWLVRPGSPSVADPRISRSITNRALRVPPPPAPAPAPATGPQTLEVNEPFHWAQLESADYRVYVANLRAVGCPEATVRDILIADVNELFSGRVKALVDEVSGQFWELITRKRDFEKVVEEKWKQLEELDDERDELLTALFGTASPHEEEEERTAAAAQREQWERLTDFLSPEKRAQLAAAKAELEGAWLEFTRTPGLTSAQSQARRKELEAGHEQSLREWLTPEEYDELRLRQSPAANLRDRFVGVGLSEEQVREAARIQFAATAAPAELAPNLAESRARTAELQRQIETRTRDLLGEESYAVLQRATDQRFEPIFRVTQRLQLPDATAAEAYGIRRQAEEAARRLRENQALSAEERQRALQAVGAETQRSLATALGGQGFAAYEKIDGDWMQQLSAMKP